jgi:signal transduction histidine kinase
MLQNRDLKSAELKDSVDLIEENAALCKNILYSLSSVEGLSSQATFSNISFNDVIARISIMLGPEMKLQNIVFQKVLQDNIPQVKGDALLFAQVMFNIVSNAKWAIKSNAAATSGTITITTQATPNKEFVEILVSDTGIGISAKDLPHIFEPFFTTKEDGLGLGLTVAERIIKDHLGQISVDTKEGKGTTVKITLPAIKT